MSEEQAEIAKAAEMDELEDLQRLAAEAGFDPDYVLTNDMQEELLRLLLLNEAARKKGQAAAAESGESWNRFGRGPVNVAIPGMTETSSCQVLEVESAAELEQWFAQNGAGCSIIGMVPRVTWSDKDHEVRSTLICFISAEMSEEQIEWLTEYQYGWERHKDLRQRLKLKRENDEARIKAEEAAKRAQEAEIGRACVANHSKLDATVHDMKKEINTLKKRLGERKK